MKRKIPVLIAASLLAATTSLAAEAPSAANNFNCDFDPACEVAPGIYGNLSAPATSKFNLSIGGYIKLDYAYNSSNFGPTGFLTPTNSPKDSSLAGQKDQSIFSVRQSRLWFRSTGPALLKGKTSAYLEFDFANTNNVLSNAENLNATPRIRHGYGLLNWDTTQVLFGQTNDTLALLTNVNMFDFNGGAQAGFFTGTRNPQIRVTQRFDLDKNNSIKFAAAVEQPYQNNFNNTGISGFAGQTHSANNTTTVGDTWGALPHFAGQLLYINKSLGTAPIIYGQGFSPLTIGFSGLYGNQHVLGQKNDKTVDTWYGAFYSFIPLIASKDGKSRANTLSFEGQAYLAANLKDATAIQFVGTSGNLNAARGFGAAASLTYFPTQNIGLSGGYGRRQALPNHDYNNISNYERYNQLYYVNAVYDLNAAVRVGVELQHFDTSYGNAKNVNTATSINSPLGGSADSGSTNIARLSVYYFF